MLLIDTDVVMEEGGESGCSSSTSISEDIRWTNWAPVIDWGPFCTDDDDFHGLIESMMCEDDKIITALEPPSSYSIPTSTTTSSEEEEEDDDKGLRLVHLLMGAAEALTGPQKSRELATVILGRLKELVPSATGSNIERLSSHFTDALQGLLDCSGKNSHRDEYSQSDALTAFQLLQDMSPYVKFGHFTANQAILEAVSGERRVHVIDYDIMEGVQWASLLQALASNSPSPHLRITAVTRGGGARRGVGTVQETGRRLAAFAASLGIAFSFAQCRLDPEERFRPNGVKVVKGEAVVANCVLQPQRSEARPVESFLAGAAAMGARVVAVVEEEAESGEGFVGRFMDELHRYSAVWDSLEAGFPTQGRARGLVERVVLGPRIAGAVGRAYRRKGIGWGEWMASRGFGRVGISGFNHCQARLLLGLFNDGYRVEEVAPNKIVLGWKSRRLLSASVWSSPMDGELNCS